MPSSGLPMQSSITSVKGTKTGPIDPFYMILNTAIDWWNNKSGTPTAVYTRWSIGVQSIGVQSIGEARD